MNLITQKGTPMEHRTSLSLLLKVARDDLGARRASRAARKTLERELASYTTPAEKRELDALLDRADPEASAEVRYIILRSRVA